MPSFDKLRSASYTLTLTQPIFVSSVGMIFTENHSSVRKTIPNLLRQLMYTLEVGLGWQHREPSELFRVKRI